MKGKALVRYLLLCRLCRHRREMLDASARVAASRRYEVIDDVGAAVVLQTAVLCAVALNP